jgi:hypothetical protein
MVHRSKVSHRGFHLPLKFIVGIISIPSAILLLLKIIGIDVFMNIPSIIPYPILEIICALGSIYGGLYMVWRTIWKPRVYVK